MIEEHNGYERDARTSGGFLEDLDVKLLDKLADIPGFNKVLTEMAQSWKKFHGSKFMFKHLEGKGEDFITKIQKFEAKVIDEANFAADVKMLDGSFLEYKSWKKSTFSLLGGQQSLKQMKNYIKSGKFEYVIDKAKLLKDGVPDPTTFVKGKFQKVFKDNAKDLFEENSEFFIKQNIPNAVVLENLAKQGKLVNHPVFNFIKVQ